MQRRTTTNMCEIKKYILDTNISSCHAGPPQGYVVVKSLYLHKITALKKSHMAGQKIVINTFFKFIHVCCCFFVV